MVHPSVVHGRLSHPVLLSKKRCPRFPGLQEGQEGPSATGQCHQHGSAPALVMPSGSEPWLGAANHKKVPGTGCC